MKILFVFEATNLYTNGTCSTCIRSAQELIKKGHDVAFLGVRPDSEDHPIKHFYRLDIFHFPVFQGLIVKEGFNFAKLDYKTMYEAIAQSDVVHLFLPFKLSKKALLIAEGLGKPVTCAFHLLPQNITSAIHMGFLHFINSALFYSFRKYLYEKVNICHTPTEMTAREMKKHHYQNECHVISNGVNLDFFAPRVVEKPENLKDKFVIVSVGRLADEKRQDLIIKAIAESRNKEKIHLILCGKGPMERAYRKLAKKKGVDVEFRFCNQEELRDILAYSDLYVHAADFEIEGISCIEAIAMGLVPLIGNARMSATHYFALNEHSLFKHGSNKDLANKIDWFIDHPKEKEEFSRQYVEKAQEYSLPREVEKLENMFSSAIKEKEEKRDILSKKGLTKKDKRKMRRIFKKLQKEGVIAEIPEKARKKPRD